MLREILLGLAPNMPYLAANAIYMTGYFTEAFTMAIKSGRRTSDSYGLYNYFNSPGIL